MSSLLNQLRADKLIAIVRNVPRQHLRPAAEALLQGGIQFIEVPLRPGDGDASREMLVGIEELKKYFGASIHVGAGTVLTCAGVDAAAAVGAEYILAPNMRPAVIHRAKEKGLLALPGAYTPTEIEEAWCEGADIVKVFPADSLGISYFKALRGPLPHIPLAAVGGVSVENIGSFLAAGAVVCGIGSNLVNEQRAVAHAWDEIRTMAAAYRRSVQEFTERDDTDGKCTDLW